MAAQKQLPLRIHVLRRLNPVIACVLKSPLHGLASKRLLLLQYQGRKSGKRYAIPLVYVTVEDRTYCVTRDTQWWKSAVSASSVTIWLRGVQLHVRAERAATTAPETRAAFEKFLTENPGTASLLYGTRIDAASASASHRRPDASDVEREIHNSNIVQLTVLPSA